MQESFFEINHPKGLIKFKIYHNLDDLCLCIESAFQNWLFRTEKYTSKSFVSYLKSKETFGLLAFTESQLNKLL